MNDGDIPLFEIRFGDITAFQWFAVNPDHPEMHQAVRYYRNPDFSGDSRCSHCGRLMHAHGWLDKPVEDQVVCPGDWVVTIPGGARFVLPNPTFTALFETKENA